MVDWNSWIKGESENEELTNSFEPSTTLGTYYIDILGAEIAKCARAALCVESIGSNPTPQVEVPAMTRSAAAIC